MKRCTLVYPVYNRLELTKQTLPVLVNNTSEDTQIYIIDDGSRVETKEWLEEFKKSHPEIIFIENNENMGIVASVNKVFENIPKGHYFAKVDNDTVIRQKNWDLWMMDCFRNHPKIGMMCLKTCPEQATPDNEYYLRVCTYFNTFDNKQLEIVREVNGNAMMINAEVIKKLGTFYEYGKYGYMDPDYSCRVDVLGYLLAFIPFMSAQLIIGDEDGDMLEDRIKLAAKYAPEFFDRQRQYREYKLPLHVENLHRRNEESEE